VIFKFMRSFLIAQIEKRPSVAALLNNSIASMRV